MEYMLAVVKPAKGTPGIKICSMRFPGISLLDAVDRCITLVGTEFTVMEESSYHAKVSQWTFDLINVEPELEEGGYFL